MDLNLDEIVQWIYTLSPLSVLSVFFWVAYLENIIPPIPGDLLVVFGGYLAAEGVVTLPSLLIVTVIASVLGFMSMYAIGSYWGYQIEQNRRVWVTRIFGKKYFERGKRWMYKWGQGVILANRFLTGTRSVIALTAGIYRTKVNYTIFNAAVSSLLWNMLLLGAGWVVNENWEAIGGYLSLYGWTIMGILALAILVRFLYVRYIRQPETSSEKKSYTKG